MKGLVWSLPLHNEMKGLHFLQPRHQQVGVLQIVLQSGLLVLYPLTSPFERTTRYQAELAAMLHAVHVLDGRGAEGAAMNV